VLDGVPVFIIFSSLGVRTTITSSRHQILFAVIEENSSLDGKNTVSDAIL
jgi:hypothetical protein